MGPLDPWGQVTCRHLIRGSEELRIQVPSSAGGFGFRVSGLRFRVEGFRVEGLRVFRVEGLRVLGLRGLGVLGLRGLGV